MGIAKFGFGTVATIVAMVVAFGLVLLTASSARAGLIGNGTNTVTASFFLGAHIPADKEGEDSGNPLTSNPATIGSGGVDFVEGAIDLSTIHVGDTQITITNLAPPSEPFGSVSDSFDGFEFQFSAGVDITGVSVDPSSAADFPPVGDGLSLISPTDILLDVKGDAPSPGNQLILDLTFPPTPEPARATLLSAALLGLCRIRPRRKS